MEVKRRTQTERSAASRAALVGAARRLFAEHGYAAVSTPQIVAAAGLTRGAMYHQFGDKIALFTAVLEHVTEEIGARVAQALAGKDNVDPITRLVNGAQAWLDACATPATARIVLVEGPAVLGWARWRGISQRHGLGLATAALRDAMDAGAIPVQPIAPLAHMLAGALDEAAHYILREPDRSRARDEIVTVLSELVRGLSRSE